MRIEILHNPIAGAGRATAAAQMLAHACAEVGHVPVLRETSRNGTDGVNPAGESDETDVLVIVGGDGTIRMAAKEAIRRDLPIFHHPFGTENLFSRQFGMDRAPETLLRAIDHGEIRTMDVATANEHLFVLMASVGIDAAIIADLADHRRGPIRHTSYIMPTLRQFWSWRPPRVSVTVDDKRLVVNRVGTVIVANSPQYALRLNPAREASMTDGAIDVVFFPLRSRVGLLPWLWRIWRGTHLSHADIVTGRGQRVEITTDEPAAYQLDGESFIHSGDRTGGRTPLIADVKPAQLHVLVPPVK